MKLVLGKDTVATQEIYYLRIRSEIANAYDIGLGGGGFNWARSTYMYLEKTWEIEFSSSEGIFITEKSISIIQ